MINSISVKNFRGIKELYVDNFKKYNFFVGDNSSCKTTLLEAIVCSIPQWAEGIVITANSRGTKVSINNIHSFFYNADINNKIEFLLNGTVKTEIKVNKKSENKKITNYLYNNYGDFNGSFEENSNYKLLYNISIEAKKRKLSDTDVFINPFFAINKKNNKSDHKLYSYEEQYDKAFWVSPLTKYNVNLAKIIKELIENKQKEKIIEIINVFEPEIDDIVSDGNEILLSKKNIEKMLPLFSYGNGLSGILDIISCFISDKVKSIFIDEIETGVHYLNYEKLCKNLIKLTQKKDIQLFITTHSKELLKIFYEELEELEDNSCLYRFQKINNEIKKVHYSKERVLKAMESGWDIR